MAMATLTKEKDNKVSGFKKAELEIQEIVEGVLDYNKYDLANEWESHVSKFAKLAEAVEKYKYKLDVAKEELEDFVTSKTLYFTENPEKGTFELKKDGTYNITVGTLQANIRGLEGYTTIVRQISLLSYQHGLLKSTMLGMEHKRDAMKETMKIFNIGMGNSDELKDQASKLIKGSKERKK